MDETLAIIESLGKRLADCRDVPAEVATVGCELHKVLLQHSGDGCGGDGPASEQLQGRASELLAEVLIVLLEATLRCGEDRDTQMKEMKVVESLLKEPLNNNTWSETVALCHWRGRVSFASRVWQWCEAHLTLLPGEEMFLNRRAGLQGISMLADWWWRPEVMSADESFVTTGAHDSATNRAAFHECAWTLFEDVFSQATRGSTVFATPGTELLSKLLSSRDIFARRIPVQRDLLRRFYEAKGLALLQRARLFSALAFVKGAAGSGSASSGGKVKSSAAPKNCAPKLLWVAREGLTCAMECLVAALTAVQVAEAQFDASCVDLHGRIRWALLGVRDQTGHDGMQSVVPNSCSPYVHPSVEPCSNRNRVTHGTGLVSTKHIAEGTLVLQDHALIYVGTEASERSAPLPKSVSQHPSGSIDTQSVERSTVANEALDLFLRGGFTHREDNTILEVVAALREGALLGNVARAADVWEALHLAALMPFSDKSSPCGNVSQLQTNEGGEDGCDFDVARDMADLMRCWDERSIPVCPPQEFKIGQGLGMGCRQRALCPTASLINHSCTPNALMFVTEAGEFAKPIRDNGHGSCTGSMCVSVVLLRDVEEGEEITVSYLSSLLIPVAMKLKQNGFICRCTFCHSKAGLLEGVLCPECRQIIYMESGADGSGSVANKTGADAGGPQNVHVDPCVLGVPAMKTHTRRYGHASDCSHAGRCSFVEMSKRILQVYATTAREIRREFMGGGRKNNGGAESVVCGGSVSLADGADVRREQLIEKEESVDIEEMDEEEQYAQLGQRAMRRLMDLDSIAYGLPTTHHLRLTTRMECLALSLTVQLTQRDNERLLLMCEELLDDLQLLLPRNLPLLTGIRLHYALTRSRYIDPDPTRVAAEEGHSHGCCGSAREQAAIISLPFMRDAVIRECVVSSFQEFYVSAAWRYTGCNESELLAKFLHEFGIELFVCGIETTQHLDMLSLMYDSAQEVEAQLSGM
ncbi:hypothetical protein TRVL_06013 [Trypanosoma vivax]|nr:hypothetical protein TRVL_06013 [Trypanosoma vivax]